MQSIEEKLEEVLMQYKLCYDLDIAMTMSELTSDEIKYLKNNDSFMYRIEYENAVIRQDIMTVMKNNMKGPDDKLAQKAAVDLGNLLWKERFKTNSEAPKGIIPDSISLIGEAPEEVLAE